MVSKARTQRARLATALTTCRVRGFLRRQHSHGRRHARQVRRETHDVVVQHVPCRLSRRVVACAEPRNLATLRCRQSRLAEEGRCQCCDQANSRGRRCSLRIRRRRARRLLQKIRRLRFRLCWRRRRRRHAVRHDAAQHRGLGRRRIQPRVGRQRLCGRTQLTLAVLGE